MPKSPDNPYGWLDGIISEANQRSNVTLGPVEFAREILGIYFFPGQRVVQKAFYGLPLVKGLWGECLAEDDPERGEKLKRWGVREDQEFDEAGIMDRWVEEKKAIWVPGHRYKSMNLEAGMGATKTVADALCHVEGVGYHYIHELLPPATERDQVYSLADTWIQTRFGPRLASHGVSRVKQRTLKVRTRLGFEVGGAPTHPVLTMSVTGDLIWKRLPEVQIGDVLCIERKPVGFGRDMALAFEPFREVRKPCQIPPHMTPELGRFLGYLIGNGSVNDPKTISLTTNDPEIMADFTQLSRELFGLEPRNDAKQGTTARSLVLSRGHLRQFLEYVGLPQTTAYDKKVPATIRAASRETVRQFLRGLFDTDGHATVARQQGHYGLKRRLHVGLASTSETLVREVQALLLGFGIVASRVFRRGNYYKQNGERNTCWTLHLYGHNARRFFQEIGFGLIRKQRVLDAAPPDTVDTNDAIPYLHPRLRAMKLREGYIKRGDVSRVHAWGRIRRQCGGTLRRDNPNGRSGVTYDKLEEIRAYFDQVPGCQDDLDFLGQLAEQRLFFDPVVACWETEEPLYDFCVPEVQEYVAGGVISHNSSITGSFAAYEFYTLDRMDDPGKQLGLLGGDPVFILSVATNETQAKDTIFAYTKARMLGSSYFATKVDSGEIEVYTTEIINRRKNIIFRAGHSKGAGLVGKNLWAFLEDECNRFQLESGATTESSGLALWNNVGKGTSRFKSSPIGGIKIAIGSAWCEGDMSDTQWRQVENGELPPEQLLCFRLCTWDINPNYTGRDDPDLSGFYASDPIGARRDYEGIRPGAQEDFFSRGDLDKFSVLKPIITYVPKDIYNTQGGKIITASEASSLDRRDYRVHRGMDLIGAVPELEYPLHSYAHGDPGVKRDSYGFAVGHGEYVAGKGLVAYIDLVLEWTPTWDPKDGKVKIPVDLPDVEEKILQICPSRNVRRVSFDHWQAEGTIQRLYTRGVITEEVTFTAPIQLAMYEVFRHRLQNELVYLPDPGSSPAADLLYWELRKLQLLHGKKVDHPKGKAKGCSKDLADCVAAVIYKIAQDERSYGGGQYMGVSIKVLGRTKVSDVKW